jgi:hypothetical protein
MKTPRVADFYPDAKVRPLKSSLDNMPAIQKPQHPPLPERVAQPKTEASQPIPERPNAPSPVRPNGKRIITRNSFEVFEDQMDSLRKLSFREKMEGKQGSMSAMVREAIDTYLQKRAPEK